MPTAAVAAGFVPVCRASRRRAVPLRGGARGASLIAGRTPGGRIPREEQRPVLVGIGVRCQYRGESESRLTLGFGVVHGGIGAAHQILCGIRLV
jgi:hypothetical protein